MALFTLSCHNGWHEQMVPTREQSCPTNGPLDKDGPRQLIYYCHPSRTMPGFWTRPSIRLTLCICCFGEATEKGLIYTIPGLHCRTPAAREVGRRPVS